jgi:glyceraldehyde 3-phosphate dehydrogenase
MMRLATLPLVVRQLFSFAGANIVSGLEEAALSFSAFGSSRRRCFSERVHWEELFMTVRVALNGFGRIGRNIFRVLYDRDDIVVAAICDVASPDHLLYLLKYDTLSGTFEAPIEIVGDSLCAKGRLIPFVEGKAPGDVNWRKYDVDIVIEASGRYRSRVDLEKHLAVGARRVILTVPPDDEIDGTIVHGVNDHELNSDKKIVSVGSLGINALAPILKILDDAFGIEEAFYTLVHAYTNKQTLGDVYKPGDLSNYDAPGDALRRSRSAPENIIPAAIGPLKICRILPQLTGKTGGMALSAAVPDGSVVDLVTFHAGPVSKEQLNAVVRTAAASRYQGIVEFSEENIVSADVTRKQQSAIFDSLMTTCIDDPTSEDGRRTMVKTLIWYDNGWSHAYRVVDLVEQLNATL